MITAIFNDKMDSTVAYGLWQWDYGQVLRIKGIELPQTAVEVHFSFEENDGDSETVIGTIKNITYDPIIDGDKIIPAETMQVLDVPIPKNFLWNNNKKDYIVCASIYISDEEMGETLKKIILPIRAKPRPVYPHASKDEELFHSTLEQVNEYAQTAIDNAQLSKSYAVGGTNTRENEDVDNAKYYAEQASASSEEATLQADNAEQSANNAKEYEENAELSANKAKEYETSSKTNADNAEEYKNWAYEYKDNAQEYSITTREYRDEAENAKNIALQASIDTGGVRDEVNRTKTQIDENIETINNQLSSATELANQVRADKEIVANNTAITNTNVETTNNNVELTNQNKTATDEALANSRQINEEVVAIKNEIMGFAEDASRIVTESIATHNISSTAHNDIRQLVVELNNKLNTVLDSDDSTLDQLSEIVNYIKDNRDLIETITTSKINVSDIIDNLTTTNNDKPLSARQGKILKDLIDAIIIPTEVSAFVNDKGYLTTETQSDWEEINIDSPAYILNKPSIKAGTGTEAIIQGLDTIASGTYSIATGRETTASGSYSHAEGYGSVASKQTGHAEGNYTIASGSYSHAEGYGSIAKNICHTEGWNTNTGDGIASHAEGMGTSTFYGGAHAEGGYFSYTIQLTGEGNALIYTYKEELSPYIINHFTHNGILKIKLGSSLNVNQNNPTHKIVDVVNINTENKTITVKKTLSETTISDKEFQILATSYAYGTGSHAEGLSTVAYGHQSHAGGKGSYALADSSFVSGNFLIGNAQAQTVIGTYNIPDDNDVTIHPNQANEYRKYAFIVGNGYLNTQTKEFVRSNAYTLDWQGNGWYQGKIAINGEPTEDQDVVTKKWVEDKGYLTVHQDISNKADKSEIPIKTSQLINDSNFMVSPTVSGTEGQVLSIGDEGTLIWKDGLKITCTDDDNGTVIINGRLSELEDGGVSTTVPTEVRQAILALFNSGAYAETGLADEIAVVQAWAATVTAIELNKSSETLDAEETGTLVATTTPAGGAVTWATSNALVATVSNGIVTPVGNGSCTITATSGDRSASCVVTVSGFSELISIDAVYTPSSDVYTFTDLDDLRSDIVVTATYDDESTAVITDYTLAGSLTQASSPVVVTYGGMTDTINVTVDTSVLYMLPWTEFKSTDTSLRTDFIPLAEDRDISFAVTFQNTSSNPSADWRLLDFLNTGDTKGLLWYVYSGRHQIKAGGTRYDLSIAHNNTAVHKVVITHAAGSNQAKIYVDGTTVKHTANSSPWVGGENLVFNRGSARYIGHVSLTAYSKVLSSSEISDFMV